MGARTEERTPLPYESRSLGYPRWEKPRGHEHRSTIFMRQDERPGTPLAEKRPYRGQIDLGGAIH